MGLGEINNLNELKKVTSGENFKQTELKINRDNGTIKAITQNSLDYTQISLNKTASQELSVAAKLLNKQELTAEEKQYKDTAQKIVGKYKQEFKKLSIQGKKQNKAELSYQFSLLANKLNQQVNTMELQAYLNAFKPPTANDIAARFRDIENDQAHVADGGDVERHLGEGSVKLTDEDGDVFFNNDVKMFNLEGKSNAQLEYINRLNTTLYCFADKVTGGQSQPLYDEINDLQDTLLHAKFDDCQQILQDKIDEWRNGNPDQKNMARLLHVLRQDIHIRPIDQGTMAYLKPGTPTYLQGNLQGTAFNFDKTTRNFDITFSDNQVTVKHNAAIKQTEPKGSHVEIHQTVTLQANLDNLSQWDYSLDCEIRSPKQDKSTAENIQKVYQLGNINSTVRII